MPVNGPVGKNANVAGIALAIQHHETSPFRAFSPHFVQEQLDGLSKQDIGTLFDMINQGVDPTNLEHLADKYDSVKVLAQDAEVLAAMKEHQSTNMVISDVDKTIIAGDQTAIAGMPALLKVLGENGGNTHVISLRVKALGLETDAVLKAGGVAINSTANGNFGTFLDAAHAHLDEAAKAVDPGDRDKLLANREQELAEAGHGKFLNSQKFDAINPGRKKDYLGDTNEGDKYFAVEKIREDDENIAAGRPSVLGTFMLHVVDNSPIPPELVEESQKPNPRVVFFKSVGELTPVLEQRGRISGDDAAAIVDSFNTDVAAGRSQ